MRKLLLLVMAFIIILPSAGLCAKKKKDEDAKKKVEEAARPKVYYRVIFKTGGVYEANNYTIEKDHIMVILDSGPIFLDKDMVTAIEKYEGDAEEPSMRINVTAATRGSAVAPSAEPGENKDEAPAVEEPEVVIEKTAPKTERPRKVVTGKAEPTPEAVTDDDGHDERWWKIRMNRWIKQREGAIKDYDDAKNEWNKYDGALANLNATGTATEYDILRFQDLRGAARIKMDRAKEDIREAEHNLKDVIPEEARKAGAPKWWVKWDEKEWEEG